MTTDHDDLLARIDENFLDIEVDSEHISAEIVNRWHRSLRAVVELHKPEGGECNECLGEFVMDTRKTYRPYPCPTIRVIEKELGCN